MKKLFLIVLVATGNTVLAQDIFQQNLYSPELILKYSEEAGLSPDQVQKIKSIYHTGLPAYNDKKWDLDIAMGKLENIIEQNTVDVQAAKDQLEKSLVLETEIKKMKLDMLVKIKNLLTPAQQAKLDTHKNETVASNSVMTPLNDNHRTAVKVSGFGSLANPLYIIIDGKGKVSGVESIDKVNPNDIESLRVLNHETAIANYGKLGENGVVIIELKK